MTPGALTGQKVAASQISKGSCCLWLSLEAETGAGQPEAKGKGPLQSQLQGANFPPSTEQAANR